MVDEASNDPRGMKLLRRLETFLDVAYALLFIQILDLLPTTDELDPTSDSFGILQVFFDRPTEMLRIVIGLGLVIIYWGLSHHFTGPLVRSDSKHATLVLMQLLSVCFFIYFAIADPNLEGGPSSPALQAIALLIAGIFGILAYRGARQRGFVDPCHSEKVRDEVLVRGCVEPVTAVMQVGTAFINPVVWTLGWFVLPVPVKWILGKLLASGEDADSDGE